MGLFDDLVEATPAKAPEAGTDAAKVETNVEANVTATPEPAKSDNEKSEEAPRETITVESLEQLPDGYVDVRTFAWELTKANLEAAQKDGRTPGPEDMVDTQSVYAATRGKRWSLPALEAVTADGTKLGIIIPLSAGLVAWNERPERGTGTGGAAMTPERRATRILRAGKTKAAFEKLTKRMDRLTKVLLPEVGATWDEVDEVYNNWLESEDGKKEIADTNKNDKNGDE
jgi:hypothetical protein